jgi:hypothetical protein
MLHFLQDACACIAKNLSTDSVLIMTDNSKKEQDNYCHQEVHDVQEKKVRIKCENKSWMYTFYSQEVLIFASEIHEKY